MRPAKRCFLDRVFPNPGSMRGNLAEPNCHAWNHDIKHRYGKTWIGCFRLCRALSDRGFPYHGFSYGRQRQSKPCHFWLPPKMTGYSCFAWAKQEYQTPCKMQAITPACFSAGQENPCGSSACRRGCEGGLWGSGSR